MAKCMCENGGEGKQVARDLCGPKPGNRAERGL
jgi:hypothetical protein